jgi:hypothetical protein
MPEDYWNEMIAANVALGSNPEVTTALRATFYFGCMISIVFLNELRQLETEEERNAAYDKWHEAVNIQTEGMMWMWRNEKRGEG